MEITVLYSFKNSIPFQYTLEHFLSFSYFGTYFTSLEMTAKYEKREKYLLYCSKLLRDHQGMLCK